ncbi:MAG: pilus assembly protein PilM, partial [Candidatus Eremiobacteraeota bacterium]|nr:pilus assembly protein PilM [Candidatus Eremiobacteraeota bacterium]
MRKSARNAKAAAAKQAGLHVVGIDDAAFALLRALPTADAIVDFGDRGTRVVVPLRPLPAVRRIP